MKRNLAAVMFVVISLLFLTGGAIIAQDPEGFTRDEFFSYLAQPGPPAPELTSVQAAVEIPTIYDYNGNATTLEWLWDEFGDVGWQRTNPHPEAPWVFKLVELRAKCGSATLVVQVVDENNRPLEKYAVIRYFPGSPELPDFSNTTARQWTTHGVVGKTNTRGDVGFGMGQGDYYFPDNGQSGASKVYVADFDGPGDLIFGLGMLGMTEHCHIDPKFQRQAKSTDPPTPTPLPPTPVSPTPTPGPSPTPGPTPVPGKGWDIHLEIIGSITPKD